ncbi:hypothetical protein ACI0FM_02965 [Paenochrobactrum sp. BZR 588]|uniref:hypothetical protein n=1 Tax=Paenochrobactrum TaxID=999488 RepID=UPI0035BC2D65
MAEQLPDGLIYQPSFPRLIRSTSMSRFGQRSIAFMESTDPVWQWTAQISLRSNAQRQKLEAFIDRCRGGVVTVHYTPKHACVPQAYWGDANNSAITGSASLSAINGNVLTLAGVKVGLKLTDGDLIGLTLGDYNFIARVVANATATGTTMQIRIEPFLPSYIGVGASIRFKNPVMNMRLIPDSFEIGTGMHPDASFQLVEVPK